MKKVMVLVVLALVTISFMFTGTMARYTRDCGNPDDKNHEKLQFSVTGAQHNTFHIKLAPGEMAAYDFVLSNASGRSISEVDMLVSLSCDIGPLPDDMRLSLWKLGSAGTVYSTNQIQRGIANLTTFKADKKASETWRLRVEWKDGPAPRPAADDRRDTAWQGRQSAIALTLTATQTKLNGRK